MYGLVEFTGTNRESMISQELSTEEHGGENTSASFGISLEVTFPLRCFSCESEQPQDEG